MSISGQADTLLAADVLVIGGGPAGAWAAWSAARAGARVVVADKGYLGSSGATAPGGTNLLYLPPDAALRDAAVRQRMEGGGYLSEPRWIHRVLDQVYESLQLVESWGYPFRRDENGVAMRDHLQGPEYLKIMRKAVHRAGVKILDQSPALELLADADGVGGARGICRLDGKRWEVRAGAVVVATGGCAFLSKGLGCNVLTGEGLLMAAEAGASLSGMEFSRAYAPSAAFGTNTRGRMLGWATFSDGDGNILHAGGPRSRDFLAEALLRGPVHAVLDRADTPEKRAILRHAHAIFFLPLERAGFDPFTQRFPITLRYEGTLRGTGGLRLSGDDCATSVAGLYAAGDAATRERVCGGLSGGGAFNASWAISSGIWAGQGAARHARNAGGAGRRLRPAGGAGVRPLAGTGAIDSGGLIHAVQQQVLPLEINYFRSEHGLRQALQRVDALWPEACGAPPAGTPQEILRVREAAALTATARWIFNAALARKETRASHTLAEYPATDPAQQHRLIVSGIDVIRTAPEAVPA